MYDLASSDGLLLFELDCAIDAVRDSSCPGLASVMLQERRALFLSPTAGQLSHNIVEQIPH
jgi:hypothetical protein